MLPKAFQHIKTDKNRTTLKVSQHAYVCQFHPITCVTDVNCNVDLKMHCLHIELNCDKSTQLSSCILPSTNKIKGVAIRRGQARVIPVIRK